MPVCLIFFLKQKRKSLRCEILLYDPILGIVKTIGTKIFNIQDLAGSQ